MYISTKYSELGLKWQRGINETQYPHDDIHSGVAVT